MVKSHLSDGKIPEPLKQETDGTVHTLLAQDNVGLAKETTLDSVRQTLNPLSFTQNDYLQVSVEDAQLDLGEIDVNIDEALGIMDDKGNRIHPAENETVEWVQTTLEEAATSDGSAFDVVIDEPLEVVSDNPVYETQQVDVEVQAEGDTLASLNTKGNDTVTLAVDAPGNNYEVTVDAASDSGKTNGNWITDFITYKGSVRDTLELGASHIRVRVTNLPSGHDATNDTITILMSAS